MCGSRLLSNPVIYLVSISLKNNKDPSNNGQSSPKIVLLVNKKQ